MMKMRINKFLSRCGVASRRKSEEILKKGIVSVNGEIILEPYHIVDTDKDIVKVKNDVVSIHPEVYIMMNKPENTVSTTSDKWGRKTVIDLLHKENILDEDIIDGIFPVGRLDMNTTGLLLLTNDGDMCNRIIHPGQNITKEYILKLSRELTDTEFQEIINSKIYIDSRRVKVENLKSTKKCHYKIVITEGRKRIIKRLFKSLGIKVEKLHRLEIGGLKLGDLEAGKWKLIDKKKIEEVFNND